MKKRNTITPIIADIIPITIKYIKVPPDKYSFKDIYFETKKFIIVKRDNMPVPIGNKIYTFIRNRLSHKAYRVYVKGHKKHIAIILKNASKKIIKPANTPNI